MSQHSPWREQLSAELGQGFIFAPVVLGLGILVYFEMPEEPLLVISLLSLLLGFGCAVLLRLSPFSWRPLFWGITLIAFGFGSAAWRSAAVAAPVLNWRYYGPVEGRVVGLDRSVSGALRVTLDQVKLGRKGPRQAPKRVRVSLYGSYADERPIAGARVMTTAHLSPPSGPAEPHGFDFQRHAWFTQMGGVGYARVPLLLVAYPAEGLSFFKLRIALSNRINLHLDGQTGAFAAAVMTGDRSGLSVETLKNLRHSNLAHLLAISGLHMGLLVAFVFAALRFGLSLIPSLASGSAVKKIAALGGLIAAGGYLGLSGGSVATERAFIMASVALGAVMLERRAISLRAVALAAMIILIRRPDAITGPGFQMSFAATTALVVVFNTISRLNAEKPPRHVIWRMIKGTVISSTVAGLATLPIAAAHFNNIAQFGLIANLASVPLMGILVIPLAVVAVCLLPVHLEWLPLTVMGWGLDWILSVAREVSSWDGAIHKVPAPPGWAYLTICFGLLCMALMISKFRFVALAPIVVGVFGWVTVQRPDILISDTGVLVGVLGAEGRALSKEKGAGFVAGVWLENDGDPSFQRAAARRWDGPKGATRIGAHVIFAVAGKRGLNAFDGCKASDIAVFSEMFERDVPCRVFDQKSLGRSGSIAISIKENGALNVTTARGVAGRRYWNDKTLRKARFGY